MQITVDLLRRFAGSRAKGETLTAIADKAATALPKYGIKTPLRLQHFFAQIAHESGGFTIAVENHRYSAANLGKMWDDKNWRRYFKSRAAMVAMAGRGEELFNIVYGDRMGNGSPASGDGFRYRGRGLAQHTGKDGYAAIARITGLPLVSQPDLVNDPAHMLECAGAFWKWKNLAPDADRDDIVAVTKKWNGGRIGLDDRKKWLAKARKIFPEALDISAKPTAPQPVDEVRGDPPLWHVQSRLKAMNYNPGNLDGLWGGMSAGAMAGFINDRKMTISPPILMEQFQKVRGVLEAEISKAESEQFVRPIAPERAEATPAELAPKLPDVKASITAERLGFWGSIGAFFSTIITGVVKFMGDAVEWLIPIKTLAGDVPWEAWIVGALIASALLYYISRKSGDAKNAATQAYQEGSRV